MRTNFADAALSANMLYMGLLLGETTQKVVSREYFQIKEGFMEDIKPLLKGLLTEKYCDYAADWIMNNIENTTDQTLTIMKYLVKTPDAETHDNYLNFAMAVDI